MYRQGRGFTLIELMIVVAIIGIIAAIGYPSYQNSVRESRRTDAYAALTAIAAQQERYFSDNNTYVTDLTQLGYPAATATSPEAYYVVTATAGASGIGSSFSLSAVAQAKGNQTADTACTSLVYTSTGAKSPANCW